MRLRLLKLSLAAAAVVWGVSLVGVFVPWSNAEELLQGLGANPIPHDPMLDYWLRMAAGAFTMIGLLFLALAVFPRRFAAIIPLFGWLMLFEGVILALHGFRLGLRPFPFYGDACACLVLGASILWFQNAALESSK
ncbi:MAG: hypothetical protein EXS35_04550 [Pedosphaera sp.]|nr:hypothetical protein [Pedosphaera sp.]